MSRRDYSTLETDKLRLMGAPEFENRLLLVKARNDLETLALFRAAVLCGRAAGIVIGNVLEQLACKPVPAAAAGQLFIADAMRIPGPGLVCFTSGSSGKAKGILRSYDSWLQTYEVQRKTLHLRRNSSVLILGDLAHSMHLYGAMESLDRGVVPTILEKFSPKHALDECRKSRLEIVYATPAHLNLILAYTQKRSVAQLATVSHILVGGAKLNERQWLRLSELFPNARIVEFFGTTETSYITIKSQEAPTGSVGKACLGVTLKITDEQGRPLPPEQEGTLWVKSDMLFEKYVFGEDRNTQWRDGFVTVGDQGYLDSSGHLFFTARKGSMVTIAGENVFLDHLERRLQAHIALGEAAILPVEDRLRGNRLIAVTQFALADDEASAVLRSLRKEFGPLKSPKAVFAIADWPFLPSGKTDRQKLKQIIAGIP